MYMWFSDIWIVLLDASMKASIVLILALAAVGLLRRAPARLRHPLLGAALIGIGVIPLLAPILPAWRVPLLPMLPALAAVEATGSMPVSHSPRAIGIAGASGSGRGGSMPSHNYEAGEMIATGAVTLNSVASDSIPIAPAVPVLVWLVGLGVSVAWLLRGLARMRGFAARGRRLDRGAWRRLTAGLHQRLGLVRPVEVIACGAVEKPVTFGWRRPLVLMPAEAEGWSRQRRAIALAHEMVHIRRNDWLFQIVAHLACSFYWFHPLAWISVSRLARERELACDEEVLGLGARPSTYARHLLDITRSISPAIPIAAAPFGAPQFHHLERRIMSILNRPRSFGRRLGSLAAILFLTAGVVVSVAAVHPWKEAPPAPDAAPVPDAPAAPVPVVLPDCVVSPAPTAPERPPLPAPDVAGPVAPAPPVPVIFDAVACPDPATAPMSPMPPMPSMVPTAPAAAAPQPDLPMPGVPVAVAPFAMAGVGHPPHGSSRHSTSISQDDDHFFFTWTDDDFSLQVKSRGAVEWEENHAGIAALGPDASVILKTGWNDSEQRLRVTAGDDGTLRYEWSVDGNDRAFDADGRAWMKVVGSIFADLHEMSRMRGELGRRHAAHGRAQARESALHGRMEHQRARELMLHQRIEALHRAHEMERLHAEPGRHGEHLEGRIDMLRARMDELLAEAEQVQGGEGEESRVRLALLHAQLRGVEVQVSGLQREMRLLERHDEMRDRDEARRDQAYERQLERAGEARRRVEAEVERLSREGEEWAREDRVQALGAEQDLDQAEARMRDRIRALRELADQITDGSSRQR